MKKNLLLLSISFILISYNTQAQTVKVISTEVFSDSLQTQQKPLLLDVRTPEEFGEGHLKNAVNYDFKNADFKSRINVLDKNKTYYVYCRSGKRSSAATEEMRTLGFKTIYELDGGILKWMEEGKKIVRVLIVN
ncbi:MAG TPA: rhodanese-like domain-containing protein [Pelobium sp.]|nr:rhodanese-like domain-containing protein [Pelobium sp.]